MDPSPQTYAALLNLHERCADGKAAVLCLRKMILQGLPPSPNFIGRAGMALLREHDADGAMRLCRVKFSMKIERMATNFHLTTLQVVGGCAR